MPIIVPSPALTDELFPKLIVPYSGGSVATWPVANTAIYVRFRVAKPRVATGLRVGIGGASGAGYAAMYTSDGTTMTRIATSASTSAAGTNTKQDVPFTATAVLPSDIDLWAFLSYDNTTVTVLRVLAGLTVFGFNFLAYGSVASSLVAPTSELISNLASTASGYVPVIEVY